MSDRGESMDHLAENPARAGLPARLMNYALIHDAMDRDSRRLPTAVVGLRTRGDAVALTRWLGRFEASVVHHHEREDDVIFPALRVRDASIDTSGMGSEHHELDAAMHELSDSLAELVAADAPSPFDGEILERPSAAAAALAGIMRTHLLGEEELVFPILTERFSDDEYADLEKEIEKGSSLSAAAFELPWVLDEANPAFITHLEGQLPFPFRLANSWFWARSYRRIAAPLLAVSG
ncbi:MAG TPA: hemerythrin domain-containing protein [Microthrixaceae bacterium]|nr:hemerythrin domain-containing protein [Microthrixaceae bacterium]